MEYQLEIQIHISNCQPCVLCRMQWTHSTEPRKSYPTRTQFQTALEFMKHDSCQSPAGTRPSCEMCTICPILPWSPLSFSPLFHLAYLSQDWVLLEAPFCLCSTMQSCCNMPLSSLMLLLWPSGKSAGPAASAQSHPHNASVAPITNCVFILSLAKGRSLIPLLHGSSEGNSLFSEN